MDEGKSRLQVLEQRKESACVTTTNEARDMANNPTPEAQLSLWPSFHKCKDAARLWGRG